MVFLCQEKKTPLSTLCDISLMENTLRGLGSWAQTMLTLMTESAFSLVHLPHLVGEVIAYSPGGASSLSPW